MLATALTLAVAPPAFSKAPSAAEPMPHLRSTDGVSQLVVDGSPFMILGGELANSSASDLGYMAPVWERTKALGVNTLLVPISWEQLEPQPGRFDFSHLDGLVHAAREHHLKLVLLWFGSWKNSMSSYVPAWVKRDQAQFPRARVQDGQAQEILTPYAPANAEADARAFSALMRRLAQTDDADHTVLMVQVENEMGMIPVARDHSPQAEAAFHAAVPAELLAYMQAHRAELAPELRRAWEMNGEKTQGDWTEVFGPGVQTDEFFAAWGFATYAQKVAQAGKAAYPLPLYLNAALIRPGKQPGQYPSGGPLPHLLDIWKAATPSIDFIAPDIYFSNFDDWASRYARPGNVMFIPEAGRAGWAQMPVNALVSFGSLHAIGFSPFSIDNVAPEKDGGIRETYAILKALAVPLTQHPADVVSVSTPVSYDGVVNAASQTIRLGRYQLEIGFAGGPAANHLTAAPGAPDGLSSTSTSIEARRSFGALIIPMETNRFLIVGVGCEIRFGDPRGDASHQVGIESIIEKKIIDGKLMDVRRLNGDESNQGRSIRFDPDHITIQEATLYDYM